ncbi:IS3 family transposase [Sphaerisporangium sp. NPDC005288]|uniref:IS3 family transposase n=1 Tax=Sphaerisporangium sp. NPDC005288 TaxID=3155114 RepID=UPI0033B1F6AE
MPMSRPPYPPEFRRQMVELVRAGRTPEELAKEFEPTAQSIRNWVVQAERDEGRREDGLTSVEKQELARLRREVRQLREEREILKEGRGFLRSGDGSAEMKYRLIDAEKARHGVSLLARVLGVSRQGYYAWKNRGPSARARQDEALTETITKIHAGSRGTYGSPRVHAELAEEFGVRIGRKRVARLMRAARLEGVHRRRRRGLTRRDPAASPAEDLVKRDFTAPGPNRTWTADITYVPTGEGWLYLAVVLDVFSRRIVGWAMADHMRTELVIDALEMAIWNRRPAPGLIHHSDQGSQYTSLSFSQRCRSAGIRTSTGTVADCFDNAVTESFFATLETELLDRHHFATRAQAKAVCFDFIEGFYNPRRRHSTLGMLSPAEYERRHDAEHNRYAAA